MSFLKLQVRGWFLRYRCEKLFCILFHHQNPLVFSNPVRVALLEKTQNKQRRIVSI